MQSPEGTQQEVLFESRLATPLGTPSPQGDHIVASASGYTDTTRKGLIDTQPQGAIRLPAEIWGRIIALLKIEIAAVNPADVSAEGYGQRDLCSVMRVSKLLNSIASPILYTRVFTKDPSALLVGLRHKPKDDTRLSKIGLLGIVQDLHLIYPVLGGGAEAGHATSLRTHSLVGLPGSSPLEMKDLVIWDITSSKIAAKQICEASTTYGRPIFGSLEKLTVISLGEKPDWEPQLQYRATRIRGSWYRPRTVEPLRRMLARVPASDQLMFQIYKHSTPRHICSDDPSGPLSLGGDLMTQAMIQGKMNPPESYTAHIYPRQLAEEEPFPIFPNTLNRWVVDHTFFEDYWKPIGNIARYVHTICNWLERVVYKLEEPQYAQTRIEIYGMLERGTSVQEPESDDDVEAKTLLERLLRGLMGEAKGGGIVCMRGTSGICPACGRCSF
ncbi:hypothetical protein IAU60_002032 [Kwoniella sp. DSM 27419]